MEHHSNIVPWQLAQPRPARVLWRRRFSTTARWMWTAGAHAQRAHPSGRRGPGFNTLGTVNPVLTDPGSACPRYSGAGGRGAGDRHQAVDLHALGADFYAVSAHKAYDRPASACCTASASGSKRPIPARRGDMIVPCRSRRHLERRALQFRGRHPPTSPGDRVRGGAGLDRGHGYWASPAASTRAPEASAAAGDSGLR